MSKWKTYFASVLQFNVLQVVRNCFGIMKGLWRTRRTYMLTSGRIYFLILFLLFYFLF